jgi:hypothetical protein
MQEYKAIELMTRKRPSYQGLKSYTVPSRSSLPFHHQNTKGPKSPKNQPQNRHKLGESDSRVQQQHSEFENPSVPNQKPRVHRQGYRSIEAIDRNQMQSRQMSEVDNWVRMPNSRESSTRGNRILKWFELMKEYKSIEVDDSCQRKIRQELKCGNTLRRQRTQDARNS